MGTSSCLVQTQVVNEARPAVGIVQFAERTAVDLVALATHGRGGLVRLFLGSVADKVLRSASVPLLICRPRVRQGNGQHAGQLPTPSMAEPASK
jgi:hypothetical protein